MKSQRFVIFGDHLSTEVVKKLQDEFTSLSFVMDESPSTPFSRILEDKRSFYQEISQLTSLNRRPLEGTFMMAAFIRKPNLDNCQSGLVKCAVALECQHNRVFKTSTDSIDQDADETQQSLLLRQTFNAAWQDMFGLDRFIENCWKLDLAESPGYRLLIDRQCRAAIWNRLVTVLPDIHVRPWAYLFIDCSSGRSLSSELSDRMEGEAVIYPKADYSKERDFSYTPIILTPVLYSETTMSALRLIQRLPALFGHSSDKKLPLVVAVCAGRQIRFQSDLGNCLIQLCRNSN